jgi:hypothetical protein
LEGSETSLAFVDHYLSLARDEDREPIVGLVAAGAGAYFGEVVRSELGATWIGDGIDPRRLRLLVRAQFIHFSPVDQAYEAIAGRALDEDDPRLPPAGVPFDPGFSLKRAQGEASADPDDDAEPTVIATTAEGAAATEAAAAEKNERPEDDDAGWLEQRLSELSPVPEDEFHSLTCRFETLKLMLELLAAKHASEGREPVEYGVEEYLVAFAGAE